MEEKILCPKCKKAHLDIKEDERGKKYFACPNCDYEIHNLLAVATNKRCPMCGDFLILKKARKGHLSFWCCHSCDFVEE